MAPPHLFRGGAPRLVQVTGRRWWGAPPPLLGVTARPRCCLLRGNPPHPGGNQEGFQIFPKTPGFEEFFHTLGRFWGSWGEVTPVSDVGKFSLMLAPRTCSPSSSVTTPGSPPPSDSTLERTEEMNVREECGWGRSTAPRPAKLRRAGGRAGPAVAGPPAGCGPLPEPGAPCSREQARAPWARAPLVLVRKDRDRDTARWRVAVPHTCCPSDHRLPLPTLHRGQSAPQGGTGGCQTCSFPGPEHGPAADTQGLFAQWEGG